MGAYTCGGSREKCTGNDFDCLIPNQHIHTQIPHIDAERRNIRPMCEAKAPEKEIYRLCNLTEKIQQKEMKYKKKITNKKYYIYMLTSEQETGKFELYLCGRLLYIYPCTCCLCVIAPVQCAMCVLVHVYVCMCVFDVYRGMYKFIGRCRTKIFVK